ncbi:MAG: pantoate--beta-alanine ligase [Phycisphaerae bacterium]
MDTVRRIPELRAAVAGARRAGRPIGVAPTMGALHAGHDALIEAARRDGCFTVVTIFVNPTQFAPHEDFDRYPRDEPADLRRCAAAGADLVFLPALADMYRPDAVTTVRVAKLADHLCGPFRPGHFDGVATIVAKLFLLVQPDRAYFGEKDAQQLAIIRRMTRDLDFPIEIVGCPTVREPDGLAMSSRNRYLSAADRARAAALHRALCAGRDAVAAGEQAADGVIAIMTGVLHAADVRDIDYASVVDPETIQNVDVICAPVLLAIAARVGAARLIDNMRATPPRA